MDKPTPQDRIRHILRAIALIREFILNVDERTFLEDVRIQSAVQYQFLIIGEAIGYVDKNLLNRYDYPWHVPRAFRNFIIHVYHGIKPERIYYAAQDLDTLENRLQLILKQEFGQAV